MAINSAPGGDGRDPDSAEQAALAARLPVGKVFREGYQLIGRHFVSAVTLTVLIGFLLYSLEAYVEGHASIAGSTLWRYALDILRNAVIAVPLALVTMPWLRQFILGERQRLHVPGSRELRGIVAVFAVLLAIDGGGVLEGRFAATAGSWLEPLAGIPWLLLHMSFELLWTSVLAVPLMLIVPAIAVDAPRPVATALAAARRDFARLAGVFVIGLAPPIALRYLAPYSLAKLYLLRADAPDVADVQRVLVLKYISYACLLVCGFALAGAAYRALAQAEAQRRTEVFD